MDVGGMGSLSAVGRGKSERLGPGKVFDGGQVLAAVVAAMFVPDAPVVFCRVCLPWPPCQPKHPCCSVPNRLGAHHVWGAWASFPNRPAALQASRLARGHAAASSGAGGHPVQQPHDDHTPPEGSF
jgi:hypothetical protein